MDLIKIALDRGQKALSEFQSKQLLKAYGIPVPGKSWPKAPTKPLP